MSEFSQGALVGAVAALVSFLVGFLSEGRFWRLRIFTQRADRHPVVVVQTKGRLHESDKAAARHRTEDLLRGTVLDGARVLIVDDAIVQIVQEAPHA